MLVGRRGKETMERGKGLPWLKGLLLMMEKEGALFCTVLISWPRSGGAERAGSKMLLCLPDFRVSTSFRVPVT